MLRRHPLLITGITLLLSGGIALAVFLLNFDLNNYRLELEQTLSEALHRPVTLGDAHLTVAAGPAFAFVDVVIGAGEADPSTLAVKNLRLKLEWDDLLQGNIAFSEIILDEPLWTITRTAPVPTAAQPSGLPAAAPALPAVLPVRDLTIRNGVWRLLDPESGIDPVLEIGAIDGRLQGQALDQPFAVALAGNLYQNGTKVALRGQGRITPAADLRHWQEYQSELTLEITGLDPQALLAALVPAGQPLPTSGALTLRADLTGSLAGGLQCRAVGRGQGFQLLLPQLWASPRPLSQFEFQGALTQNSAGWSLADAQLTVDGLALSGRLALSGAGETARLAAALTASPLALTALMQLEPLRAILPAPWRPTGGTVEIHAATLEGPLRDLGDPHQVLAALRTQLTLRELTVPLHDLPPLEKLSAAALWNGAKLELNNGTALWAGRPQSFSGFLERPWEEDFPLGLTLTGEVESAQLLGRLVPNRSPALDVSGPLRFKISGTGTRNRLQATVQSDLGAVAVRFGSQVHKPAGMAGELDLRLELSPETLRLTDGRVQMSPLELTSQGEWSLRSKEFRFAVQAPELDLQACRPYLPLLGHLEARGRVSLQHQFQGAGGHLHHHQGTALLDKVGVHLTRVIADLNDVSGELLIAPDGISSRNLTLKLGSSPLTVAARLENFAAPRLDLQVKGEAVRADDVIFHNDQVYLRDLDGRLRIDREGIAFAPVRVRLDGGTVATVNGAVRNFANPQTRLDIDASYGNIDEVIALWQRSQPPAAPATATAKPSPRPPRETDLLIRVNAEQGQLGNLRFQNAQGEISLRNGTLTIFPLRFAAGPGVCRAHVAVDHSTGSPPLLKISGELDRFDASAIHQQVLQRKGLLTGTLNGDFYLEGRAGKTFMKTADGGFAFKIENGVLRKLQVLSKVFSLLNVAQLFNLQLPDMDTEGMPFNHFQGTASLRRGVLSTQDLFIDSHAMDISMVGEVDLPQDRVDMILAIKPLRTVDKIVTNIPLAGWLLAGEEKALITAQFKVTGPLDKSEVTAIPITSVSDTVLGIFRRTLGLPAKIVSDVGELLK